ncbi:MAG TPA: transglycosylase SLT domain-containing protein [Vicinamibacterales bacterium]|nr:transglycosylase SLT domain-containing protein [Vicinamibacterales bacterium]
MVPRRTTTHLAVFALLPLVAACGSGVRKAPLAAAPPGPVLSSAPVASASLPPGPTVDPVVALIAESDRHFKAGQAELEAGHVEGARQEFDRAVNVLVESPFGGRTEPRIREQFDRLVDRISTYEVKALAQGDGFTEKNYDPASIDELLAVSATLVPPSVNADLQNTVKSDIQAGQHDIPIPLNERVLSFIELFQGRLHDFLEQGMRRGSKYLPMIQNVFRAEGLPLDLAYVPLVESAFNPNALSRAQAKGVWQFMRGTGVENGLRQDWYIDERSDPEKATVAAAKYLNTLAGMFNGDWHLALASYNGGPGRLQKAMKAGRASDFWDLAAKPRILPRETRDYVPMILAAIVIARNPAQYGFEFESEAPHTYETLTLDRPVDLRRIAEWADTTISQIQTLNPELRRWTTPIRDDEYTLKVPVGTADVVKAKLVDTSTAGLASLRWYTVKRGDTLATIARTLRVSRADLAAANYLKATSRVTPGSKLMVPHESTVLMAARADRPAPATESRALVADAVVPAVAASGGQRVKVSYRVKRGDTLATIARAFGTTVNALKTWNRLPGSRIAAGDRLTIYTAQAN